MDFLVILEQYGVPIAVAIAFGFFIWKQNQFIQGELTKELRESFNRIEGIIIGLINAQKKHSIDLKGLTKSYQAIVDIVSKLIKKSDKLK
tara:strand:- start:24 stop:293 length:270 start_codon:yes stop_codon:yes gene_type:complete